MYTLFKLFLTPFRTVAKTVNCYVGKALSRALLFRRNTQLTAQMQVSTFLFYYMNSFTQNRNIYLTNK